MLVYQRVNVLFFLDFAVPLTASNSVSQKWLNIILLCQPRRTQVHTNHLRVGEGADQPELRRILGGSIAPERAGSG